MRVSQEIHLHIFRKVGDTVAESQRCVFEDVLLLS